MSSETDRKMFKKVHGTSSDPLNAYITDHSLRLHPAQKELIKQTVETKGRAAAMMGSSDELQLLANLVKTIKGKKTLDIGVFTGYSALTIALALPDDGKIVACDVTDKYLTEGKAAFREAGVDHKIDLRIAPAVDTLKSLIANGEAGTFDFAFIDADKANYSTYYDLCKELVRSGGIIAVDNVLWGGRVVDPSDTTEDTEAIRAVNKKIAADQTVDISMLNMGDGTTLIFKR